MMLMKGVLRLIFFETKRGCVTKGMMFLYFCIGELESESSQVKADAKAGSA